MTDGRAFYWPGLTFDDAPELLFSFVGQYYEQLTPPPRILLPWLPATVQEADGEDGGTDGDPDERSLLEQALSERRGGPVRALCLLNLTVQQLNITFRQANSLCLIPATLQLWTVLAVWIFKRLRELKIFSSAVKGFSTQL